MGFVLTQLDAFNAIFASQQNTKNPDKFELTLMVKWLCDNIPKFRKFGAEGNNFRGTRNSLPPFASKTTFGGHGFGGAAGSPSHEAAKKLCAPIQLAKIATVHTLEKEAEEAASPTSPSISSPKKLAFTVDDLSRDIGLKMALEQNPFIDQSETADMIMQ